MARPSTRRTRRTLDLGSREERTLNLNYAALSSPSLIDADACLALEDGRVFFGRSFGSPPDAEGEVVFTTSMAGYQEIATDPSYRGQMVVLTHPQVGNYGVQPLARESTRPWITALVVRDLAPEPSH